MKTKKPKDQILSNSTLLHPGEAYRVLREARGFTQADVAQFNAPGSPNYICSETTLRNFENNKSMVQDKTLHRLLKVIGYTMEQYKDICTGQDKKKFDADFTQVKNAGFAVEFDLMEDRLITLKKQWYCNANNKHIAQAVQLAEGILLYGKYNNPTKAYTVLLNALKLTMPSRAFAKDGSGLNCKNVSTSTNFVNEFYIVKTMAVIKHNQGDTKLAIRLYQALLHRLKSGNIDHDIKEEVMITICFSLALSLLAEKQWIEAEAVADKAIEFSQQTNNTKLLGDLYWSKGRALIGQGKDDEGLRYLTNSINTSKLHGEHKRAENSIKLAKEKYGIILPN